MTTYRCHGYPVTLGTDTKAMMAEIFGRKTGLCGGYGGSMHLTDVERGFSVSALEWYMLGRKRAGMRPDRVAPSQ